MRKTRAWLVRCSGGVEEDEDAAGTTSDVEEEDGVRDADGSAGDSGPPSTWRKTTTWARLGQF
jgi:hypothetical protein